MEAVGKLARAATGDFAVDAMLRELCEAAARALAVDGAGVMGVDGGTTARFVHADGPDRLAAAEEAQEVLRQGPCQDCAKTGHVVVASDLAADDRWASYAAVALEAQMRAVVAVPLVSRGRTWGTLDLYRRAAGEWTAEELAAARLLADVAVSYVVMAVDRDAARAAQHELARRATTDPLTGLPNRALLFDRLEHALAAARRHRRGLAAVFVDLDRFKEVNDAFGHAAGDAVLVEVSRRLGAARRRSDTLARLAGDEFVLLCEDLPGDDGPELHHLVAAITGRLRAALDRPVRVGDGADVAVSASLGVAVVTADDAPGAAEDLLRDADAAMYAAKGSGRGRTVVCDGAPGAGRRLERDLAHALDRGQLRVHYQPVVEAAGGRIGAVEALVRWEHPTHGLLPAAAFVPLAEATGTLARIGRWVVGQGCAQLRSWQEALGGRAPGTVFCNLSPRQLLDPALGTAVDDALGAFGLEPRHLGLEILEDAFADPRLVGVLAGYQRSGHPLSVDDFGTGYSSLSRLVHLPADYAKIDKSFVAALPDDARARALVDAVLVVAGNLGLTVVGEGVENQRQADHLAAAGCPLLQGFHLARPMAAQRLTPLLAASS